MDVKYPTGHWLNGHFRAVGQTSGITPVANAILMAMRWADPDRFCVIERLKISVVVNQAIAAQLTEPLVATFQRGYTKKETTGVNNLSFLPTGVSGQSFLAMSGTSLVQLAIGNLAAGLSGGVRVADQKPCGFLDAGGLGALNTSVVGDMFQFGGIEQFPLILSKDEGLLVQWGPTALATGQIVFTCQVTWAEVSN